VVDALFDDDIKIKDKRLFVRNLEARAFLGAALDELTSPVQPFLAHFPIIVQRRDKFRVILRIWPLEGAAYSPEQELEALITLNLCWSHPRISALDMNREEFIRLAPAP
jgi:hypothetical protein